MYSSQESLVQAFSCEFWKNFKNIYVVEHLWTHTCVKWSKWILKKFQEHLCCRTSVNAYLREMKQWKNVFTEICSQKNTGEGVV